MNIYVEIFLISLITAFLGGMVTWMWILFWREARESRKNYRGYSETPYERIHHAEDHRPHRDRFHD